MVGIPGIEPGVGFPDGVTVRSRTLRGDALILVAPTRFELVTPVLSGLCSTTELRGNINLEDTLGHLSGLA